MTHLPELDAAEMAQRLDEGYRSEGAQFVFAELATGLNICRLLRLNEPATEEARTWKIARAQIALEVAEDSMWELNVSHPDFNQIIALAERLKFEIEDLYHS